MIAVRIMVLMVEMMMVYGIRGCDESICGDDGWCG